MPRNETKNKQEILLIEFKAPRDLMEAFDDKLTSKFSSRSEAIRALIRTFLEARTEDT